MIVVAARPFEEDFADTAQLHRALDDHALAVVPDPAAQAELLREAQILVTSFERQTHDPLEYARAMPALRWIHSITAGIGSVASAEIAERAIVVTNGAGVFAPSIAEYVVASLVMLARGLPELVLAGAARRWDHGHPLGRELAGARAGVIGHGGIGRRVAELLSAIGMRVDAVTRTPGPRGAAASVRGIEALGDLLEVSDAVVLCASLNPGTRGLLGERELSRCKPGALFVNVSRGALVDEPALARALTDGPLAGAVIDVAVAEPLPAGSPLWDVPNLWITPHIAGGTREGRARALERFVVNLPHFAAGRLEQMTSVVDVGREL
jgi:phosphoglycerate dehydrogenase-like enzyme